MDENGEEKKGRTEGKIEFTVKVALVFLRETFYFNHSSKLNLCIIKH